jgi:hypothetical protein
MAHNANTHPPKVAERIKAARPRPKKSIPNIVSSFAAPMPSRYQAAKSPQPPSLHDIRKSIHRSVFHPHQHDAFDKMLLPDQIKDDARQKRHTGSARAGFPSGTQISITFGGSEAHLFSKKDESNLI